MRRAVQSPRDFFLGLITGHALSLKKSRPNYMDTCLKKYGSLMEMYLGKKRTLLVNDPVGLKYLLFDHSKNYPKEFKLTNSSKSINVQMNAQVSLRPDQDIYLELEERQ